MLYFLASDAVYGAMLLSLLLICFAFGIAFTFPSAEKRRAGRGARHRAPGLPRFTRSGTTPRRRDGLAA